MAKFSYKLELEDKKRNIFVTQLNERDEEDDHVTAHPIVRESASRLIDTGINTLQKTLLLKKEVEIDGVERQLYNKRNEFKERMEVCAERRLELQKKQQKMKDQVTQHERFINDVEAKRRRAIQKYESEVRMKEQKTLELDNSRQQLEDLKKRHAHLTRKINAYNRYEKYLLRVLENMPENYIEMQDNMMISLMMRHKTLSETNKDLVIGLTEKADELEAYRQKLERTKQEHEKQLLSINSQLHQLQKIQEDKIDANQEKEESFMSNKAEFRRRRAEIGVIMMAINNIVERTTKLSDRGAEIMTLDEKLNRIQIHVKERIDVLKIASARESPSESRSKTSGKSRKLASSPKPEKNVQFVD